MMRVIAGRLARRQLQAPAGKQTRPSSDRLRGVLFNILQHQSWAPELRDASVLDLFAGSGALGIEALSRGAAKAIFIEQDPAALRVLRDNCRQLQLLACSSIIAGDARLLGRAEQAVDLVFIDPPYGQNLLLAAWPCLCRGGWLRPGSLLVIEQDKKTPEILPAELIVRDNRAIGRSALVFAEVTAASVAAGQSAPPTLPPSAE